MRGEVATSERSGHYRVQTNIEESATAGYKPPLSSVLFVPFPDVAGRLPGTNPGVERSLN